MQDLNIEIDKAIDLLDATYKQTTEKKKVLLDKGKTVYLQVVLFKTPFSAPRKRKFLRLRHSLYGNEPEICLFVPNRKTGVDYKKTTDELIDFCVDYYTEILEKHKVKGITTVMPLKQLKSEYGAYELRRKLVHRFDLFLCKNSLLYNSRFLTSLGKIFRVANKEPLGVPFPKEDVEYDPEFQKNVERAIFTSSFYISRFSDNYSIPFGCLSNTKMELKENLQLVLHQILNENIIPGGIKNVRAMYLWPSQSKPIPLYISTELPVGMKKPSIKSNRKRPKGVEGEISTQPWKKVFVTPRGEVFITKAKRDSTEPQVCDSEDEDSFKDESDDDGDGDDGDVDEEKNLNSKDKETECKEESESEDDEEIEKKEARLMGIRERNDYSTSFQNVGESNESNVKVNRKQKVIRRENGTSDCNMEVKKKKEKKEKMNKAKRKMLIKQDKSKASEGIGRMRKRRI